MKKNYILLLLNIVFAFSMRSQNLPYLNASAGNANQSVVDKDTNLYMFHSSRLEKVNKNLVPIWVNTYSNLTFSNLLLSKTGSIFFIAQNKIGKITANGNLDWVSTLNSIGTGTAQLTGLSIKQLLLDRNNNLVITGLGSSSSSGKSFFLKLDTLGNFIKSRTFTSVSNTSVTNDNFNIINDSLGNYRIYLDDVTLGGRYGHMYTYSESADSITVKKELGSYDVFNANPYGQPVHFYKSKFGSSFYVCSDSKNNMSAGIIAITKFSTVKGKTFLYSIGNWGIDSYFENFNEDEKGNLILSGRAVISLGYDRGCELLDSNCVRINGVKIINNQQNPSNPPFGSINSRPHVLYNNNYYFDALGSPFPSNPLTMANITASLPCYTTMPIGTSGSCTTPSCFYGNTPSTITTTNPGSVSITPFTSTAALVNFSVVQNYCPMIITSIKNESADNNDVLLYPNPFNTNIVVTSNVPGPLKLEIYNALGALMKVFILDQTANEIRLQDLSNGIYFVKIYSVDKISIKKIVKN